VSLSRRDFIRGAGAGTVDGLLTSSWGATQSVEPVTQVDNPLKSYPNRDWEQVYHDIYAYDGMDWTVCHSNCTQSCALNFYVSRVSGTDRKSKELREHDYGVTTWPTCYRPYRVSASSRAQRSGRCPSRGVPS